MKVSIIVPVYNTAPWLDRCIESLVNQTYQDIEIILVNDGSTDNSRQVCAYWQEKDQRIKYLYKENGGQASARNMGLDYATGDYIAFVDSDDCVMPQYVEQLVRACVENKTEISFCGYALTDEFTPADKTDLPDEAYNTEIISQYDYFERIYSHQEIAYVVVWNKLYHRNIFADVRFNEVRMYEDEGVIHHIISKCDKIAVFYQPLYLYAVRQNSTMTTPGFSEKNLLILPMLEERISYFKSKEWHTLVYLTIKNYLVHCLSIYNRIDNSDKNLHNYRNQIMAAYKQMLDELKKNPVKSKKFILQMEYYGLFPKKFAEVDRNTFLFG